MKRSKLNYTPKNLMKALKSIQDGKYKICEAARIYDIPRQTLADKIRGRRPASFCRPGPQAVLGEEVESKIVTWLLNASRLGFPLNREALVYSVKHILHQIPENVRASIPFRNNTPGNGWFKSFRKRHPQLAAEYAENMKRAKTALTEQQILDWFQNVEKALHELNAGSAVYNASRVYAMEETKVCFRSRADLLLLDKRKNSRNVGDEDMTVFLASNAAGKFAPPVLIGKESSFAVTLKESLPQEWTFRSNESCSMSCETFHAYVTDVFCPFLRKSGVTFPVVAFVNGDFNYVSLPLYEFCQENKIVLVCMPYNSSHILQPLNLTSFFPFETVPNEFLEQDSRGGDSHPVVLLVNDLLTRPDIEYFIVRRMGECGIFPFSPCPLSSAKCDAEAPVYEEEYGSSNNVIIEYIESKIPTKILEEFRCCRLTNSDWKGIVGYAALYEFWLSVINDVEANLLVPVAADVSGAKWENDFNLESYILEEEVDEVKVANVPNE